MAGCAGLMATENTAQLERSDRHPGNPRGLTSFQVAPPSTLLKTPPSALVAYQTGGVLVSTTSVAGPRDDRFPSGRHDAPSSVLAANCVAVLRLPLVTGKSYDDVTPPTITNADGSVSIAFTCSLPLA